MDGVCGRACVNGKSAAIVVFDFVEYLGPFDEQVYAFTRNIKEAHVLVPPPDWVEEIKRRFGGTYEEYIRTAFAPLDVDSEDVRQINGEQSPLRIDGDIVEIKPIDGGIERELMKEHWSMDIVCNTMMDTGLGGFGFAAVLNGKILGGIGCYTRYADGIEVEIDTHEDFRRKGVATALAKRMIKECRNRGVECHWDAMNKESAALARKLGFQKTKEYLCVRLAYKNT